MRFSFILLLALLFPIAGDEVAFAQQAVKGMVRATPYINGTFRALVIGNDKYRDPEGLWKPLKTAVKDARAVADVLKTQYGFGDVRLLLNATRRQMGRAINRITEDSRENDSVLIYYAGHGFLRQSTKEGYWIPVDAEGRDDTTYFRNSTIKTKLGVLSERAKHVLLVSDSCFSGALLREGNRGISIERRNESYFRSVAAKKSVQILAAGGLEFVDDNYKGTGHSPFTYFFLEELKTKTDGLLDATTLSNAVVRNVANNVRQSPQKGVLHGAGHAGGEFFFAKTNFVPPAPVAGTQPRPAPQARQTINAEEEFWKSVRDSGDASLIQAYVKEYPNGRFVALARVKLILAKKDSLQKQQQAQREKEDRLWNSVKGATDAFQLQAYLDGYPQGRYADVARLKLRKIRSKPMPPAKAALAPQIKPLLQRKPKTGVSKIAFFPIIDPTNRFRNKLLRKISKIFAGSRKKYRLTHSFFNHGLSDVVYFGDEEKMVKDPWSGFWNKKPNQETVFKAGQRLGADFLLMYKIDSGTCGKSLLGSDFIVYLLNVKTKDIHEKKGEWTCEDMGLEPAAAIKKLLEEHAAN